MPSRIPAALLGLASLVFAARIVLLMTGHSALDLAKFYMADDTFYYLVIGQNIAAGAGSTFDGIATTNGYHPLWQLFCVLLFLALPAGSGAAVMTVFAVQGLLVLAAVWLLHSALRRFDAMASAITLTLFLATPLALGVLCNGMESGLAFALAAAVLALAAAQGADFYRIASSGDGALKAGLLTALTFARLEAGLLAALLVAEALLREGLPRLRGARLGPGALLRAIPPFCLVVGGVLAVTGAAYVALNFRLVGYPEPISGVVKTMWQPTEAVFQSTVRLYLVAMSGVFETSARLQALAPALLALQLAGLAAWGFTAPGRRFLALTRPFLLFAAGFVLLAIFATSGGFLWYLWPALLIALLSTFALAAVLLRALAGPGRPAAAAGGGPAGASGLERSGASGADQRAGASGAGSAGASGAGSSGASGASRLAASAGLAALALLGVRAVHDATKPPPALLYDWGIAPDLVDGAIAFIETGIPPAEALAGHSVGILSYFTGRPIQQTEGLVNDRAYWEALKQGQGFAELYRRGVRWLVANTLDQADFERRVAALVPPCVRREERRIAAPRAEGAGMTGDVVFLRLDATGCGPALGS